MENQMIWSVFNHVKILFQTEKFQNFLFFNSSEHADWKYIFTVKDKTD